MSNNKDTLALHAHEMRQAPTDSEARLWRALCSSQLGVAFRRQVPLLGFIADFYAPAARLVVEVDGGYHARHVSADASRDRKLARAAIASSGFRLSSSCAISPPPCWRCVPRSVNAERNCWAPVQAHERQDFGAEEAAA